MLVNGQQTYLREVTSAASSTRFCSSHIERKGAGIAVSSGACRVCSCLPLAVLLALLTNNALAIPDGNDIVILIVQGMYLGYVKLPARKDTCNMASKDGRCGKQLWNDYPVARAGSSGMGEGGVVKPK